MTATLALSIVTMTWCWSGLVNRIALSPDIRVIVHTEAIRNVYVSITKTAHEASFHVSGPIKLFSTFNICRGIAAFRASATDNENNNRSAIFHGLYKPRVVIIKKCPQIRSKITTSTISPKMGFTWKGTVGTLGVALGKKSEAGEDITKVASSFPVWYLGEGVEY